jgi:hypothetical protein
MLTGVWGISPYIPKQRAKDEYIKCSGGPQTVSFVANSEFYRTAKELVGPVMADLGLKRKTNTTWVTEKCSVFLQRSQSNGTPGSPDRFTTNFEFDGSFFPVGSTRLGMLCSDVDLARWFQIQSAILERSEMFDVPTDPVLLELRNRKISQLCSGDRNNFWMGYWSDADLRECLAFTAEVLPECWRKFSAAGPDYKW